MQASGNEGGRKYSSIVLRGIAANPEEGNFRHYVLVICVCVFICIL